MWGRPRVFLPVIHPCYGIDFALAQIDLARKCGADGVFLINQGMAPEDVITLGSRAAANHPGFWLGLNLLGKEPEEVLEYLAEINSLEVFRGLWADDCGADWLNDSVEKVRRDEMRSSRDKTGWKGLYFGGTAFKTQGWIPNWRLGEVALRGSRLCDVVTTSGAGTGVAASPERIDRMRRAIPGVPIGLASGVTPGNVLSYIPYVQAFLVASGIEKKFGVLDPARTSEVASLVHSQV